MIVAVSETLRGRLRNGLMVASAPLITDLPIVLLALFIVERLSRTTDLLPALQVAGGIYLIYLAYTNIRGRKTTNTGPGVGSSLRKGIIANFLNPSPYLWWITVGAPTVLSAWGESKSYAISFVLTFYSLLIGGKMMVVVITNRYRQFVESRAYQMTLWVLGGLLGVFGLYFLIAGLTAIICQ